MFSSRKTERFSGKYHLNLIYEIMCVETSNNILHHNTKKYSPREDIFRQAETKQQRRCCNGTLKPQISLLMQGYKYSTGKNLSCCCSPCTQRHAGSDGLTLIILAMETYAEDSTDETQTPALSSPLNNSTLVSCLKGVIRFFLSPGWAVGPHLRMQREWILMVMNS